jgi:hypothetical protein
MQLCRRHLAFGETDHELIWLSVSLVSLSGAAAWLALGLPWPQCLFHAITGLPCVTCGATRSVIAFFHGQFFTAWKWNPLALAFSCAMSIFNIYAGIILATRAPRLRIGGFSSVEKGLIRVLVLTLLASNWIYLLFHSRSF